MYKCTVCFCNQAKTSSDDPSSFPCVFTLQPTATPLVAAYVCPTVLYAVVSIILLYSIILAHTSLCFHPRENHYVLSSQAAVAAAASVPVTPPASLPVTQQQATVPAGLPNQAPIENLPANQNVPDPAFINPDGANQNIRMNAQGGPVMEDEEDVERDWLDWVYTASRFAVFLSIVYFYSNLSRFVLVMSSLLLMYL